MSWRNLSGFQLSAGVEHDAADDQHGDACANVGVGRIHFHTVNAVFETAGHGHPEVRRYPKEECCHSEHAACMNHTSILTPVNPPRPATAVPEGYRYQGITVACRMLYRGRPQPPARGAGAPHRR